MKSLIRFVVAALVMLVMDTIWLGGPGQQFYLDNLGSIMRMSDQGVEIHYLSAIFVYILMASSVVFFVVPKANGHLLKAIFWGAMLGLTIYGIYNYTNLAILSGWTSTIAIIDTIWGMFLFAMTSLVVCWLNK